MTAAVSPANVFRLILLGLSINIFGSIFSSQLNGLLFLDTIGTALVALALGPIWGASIGAMTNLMVAQIPGKEFYLNYLVVNVICGFMWGYLSFTRFGIFQKFTSYFRLLLSLLFLGLIVSSIASAISLVITFNYEIFIKNFDQESLRSWHVADQYYSWLLNREYVDSNGTIFQVMIRDVIAVLPDKVVSIGLSAVLIYYFFPAVAQKMASRSYQHVNFVHWSAYVSFLLPYSIAFLSIAFQGHVVMDSEFTTIKTRVFILPEVFLWILPFAFVAYTMVKGRMTKRCEMIYREASLEFSDRLVWVVYRDILTILAASFTLLFAFENTAVATHANAEVLSYIERILQDGFGILGFFAIFGYFPLFMMRVLGVDPTLKNQN